MRTSSMSDRYFEILRDSRLSWNDIPLGRQLPRTPPLTGVKKHLDFCNEDTSEDHENQQQNVEAETTAQEDNNQNVTFDFNTHETETEPHEPNSMLKGMKGYQLTQIDLEFIENMKVEKLIKKLQGDLEEVWRLLKTEKMSLELALASREKTQADLKMLPSCEDLLELLKVVFRVTSPSTQLPDLASLMDMATRENIQRVSDEKRLELTRMENVAANKRKKAAQERGQLEKQIASERLKIQGLMSQLTNLKSELAQQEEVYKALKMQTNTPEAGEASEKQQATKRRAKGRGKGGTKAVNFTEKLQGATNVSKSTKGKLADDKTDKQSSVKYDRANKNTWETPKTKRKPAAAEKPQRSVKGARGPLKKVEEQEANSQESVRGRRKRLLPTATAASLPKKQSGGKTGEASSTSRPAAPSQDRKHAAAGDAEESRDTVLRRSKRIASRR
ncbi:myosin-11-like isoform X2 [Cottoperca gobio]|uniref:Myosin-11-like isoform X2 n=1 Tax=Cottoperca gobio TaxID=56716 RepID=A0A6J2R8U7_COTGO|nr:myosin-11-like isoform X2 [Cottoperca gobio]